MAIIYIHGVAVRRPKLGEELKKSFDRWLHDKFGGKKASLYLPPREGVRRARQGRAMKNLLLPH